MEPDPRASRVRNNSDSVDTGPRSEKWPPSPRWRWMDRAYVSTCQRGEEGVKLPGLTAWHLASSVREFKQVSVTSADNRKPLCSEGTSCSCQLAGFDVALGRP